MSIETSGRRPPGRYKPPLVSWEEFHDWALGQEHRVEWVDGEIIELMPDNIRHYLLTRFLSDILRYHGEEDGHGLVLMSTILMRLSIRPSGRMPDLFYVIRERLDRLKDTVFDGPADLAVEVVSPDSRTRDHRDKLAEYETAGIREYWLINPLRNEALFYILDASGHYQQAVLDSDGVYTSTVLPDLRLRVEWLWRDPLPKLREALADLRA